MVQNPDKLDNDIRRRVENVVINLREPYQVEKKFSEALVKI